MKKVAFFISSYTIGNSPSLLNIIEYLGGIYSVTLFLKYVALVPNDLFKKVNRVIRIKDRYKKLYCLLNIFPQRNKFDIYIAVDPHGFFLCKNLFTNSVPFYYSLELFMKDDHFGLDYSDMICDFERKNINNINGLIIQSKGKGDLFKKDYNLSDNIPIFYLPVTYKGHSTNEKNDYLRIKYSIPKEQKIAVHLGGIAEWFSCIEVANEFSKLKNWVLFFQGYPSKEYLIKFKKYIKDEKLNNIIISDEILENIDDLDKILKSCDIGIAWYNNISIGFRMAGKSSGKITAYLKYGLPVITNNYPESLDSIEKTQAGVCIESINQIPVAVDAISKNYEYYSKNAMIEYDTNYNFENYKLSLFNFLEGSYQYHANKAKSAYWEEGYNNIDFSIVSKDDPIRKIVEKYIPQQNEKLNGEGAECIEIGSYPGRYLAIFGIMGYILNGIDMIDKIEDDMKLWLLGEGYKTGLFKKVDFWEFETKKKYDIVCSFGFLEHFIDWESVIIKKFLLVKNGGYLVVFVPNFLGIIQKILHILLDYDNYCRHYVKSMNPDKWIKCLSRQNFSVIYKGYLGGFDFWVDNQNRSIFQKRILNIVLRMKEKLTWLPNSKIYSPYCGLILQRLED